MSNALAPMKLDDVHSGEHGKLIQLVSFNLAQEEYGVDVLKVREIIRMPIITRVPNTPNYVEGVDQPAWQGDPDHRHAETVLLGRRRP